MVVKKCTIVPIIRNINVFTGIDWKWHFLVEGQIHLPTEIENIQYGSNSSNSDYLINSGWKWKWTWYLHKSSFNSLKCSAIPQHFQSYIHIHLIITEKCFSLSYVCWISQNTNICITLIRIIGNESKQPWKPPNVTRCIHQKGHIVLKYISVFRSKSNPSIWNDTRVFGEQRCLPKIHNFNRIHLTDLSFMRKWS